MNAKEKAEQLGVPLIPSPPPIKQKADNKIDFDYKEFKPPVIGVCETCSKEITHIKQGS